MQSPSTHRWFVFLSWALFVALIIVSISIHLWDLGGTPSAFWPDEQVNREHAQSIAQTGRDTQGNSFPLFFRTVDDFRSPVFIYSAAALFRIFGSSVFLIRLVSALYFFAFLATILFLVHSLWPGRNVLIFTLLAGGFLPWFFTFSRVAYIIVPQLTFFAAALFFLHQAFHRKGRNALHAALAGIFFGLCIYTYPSARLLIPLFLLLICALYLRRPTLRLVGILIGSACVVALPFAVQLMLRPGTMTATTNFRSVSYLFSNIPFLEKVGRFLWNEIHFFHPDFLFISGSLNLHHHTGFGGELFFTTGFLAILGLVHILRAGSRDRFGMFLIVGAILSPLVGALTNDAEWSVPRSILLGVFLFMLSCYGFATLLHLRNPLVRGIVISVVFLSIGTESAFYLHDYFTNYPSLSWKIFDNVNGLGAAMRLALHEEPQAILLDSALDQQWISWSLDEIPLRWNVNVTSSAPSVVPGGCVIFARSHFDSSLESPRLSWVKIPVPRHDETQLRCYGSPVQ